MNEHENLAPHSVEAEEAVLGSILLTQGDILDDLPDLRPQDFFMVRNEWVYEAMLALRHRREGIDNLSLAAELRIAKHLEDVGGTSYLTRLINETPTHIHYYVYAGIVREASRRRQALDLASEIARAALTGSKEAVKDAARQLHELVNVPESPQDTMRHYSVHVRDLKHLPPVSWLVPGELPERGITMLFGPSGIGKSFVALDYALRLAQDQPIVYVAAEGQAGYHVRTAAWSKYNKADLDSLELIFFLRMLSLLDAKESDEFIDIYRPIQPKLVVVDTMSLCMLPGDENSARDIALFIKASQKIQAALQCALLFVHHTGKEGKDYRGSSALRANCDVMIRLSGDDDVITVECTKSKDAAAFPRRYIKLLPVTVDDGSSQVVVPSDLVEQTAMDPLTSKQRLVLEALELATLRDGATTNDICDVTNMGRGSVLARMSHLIKFGFVAKGTTNPPMYIITEEGLAALNRESLTPLTPPDSFADSSVFPHGQTLTPLTPQVDHDSADFSDRDSAIPRSQTSQASQTSQDSLFPLPIIYP